MKILQPIEVTEVYHLSEDFSLTYVRYSGEFQRVVFHIPHVIRRDDKKYRTLPETITLYEKESPKGRKRLDLNQIDSSVKDLFSKLPKHVADVIQNGVFGRYYK